MSIHTPLVNAILARPERTSRARRFALGAVTGLVAALVLIPAVAIGHAELDTVTPADKSTVQGSPTEIVMTFVQNLDPTKSSIRVVDASSKVVAEGGTVPSGNPREMDLALTTPLAPGKYTIRWTTFSTEDQETARGTTTFTVAAAPSPSPTPSVVPSASVAPPSASPSAVPSAAVSVAPSTPPTTPATSTSDAVIPVVVALIVLAGLGLWLLRGRSRARS